MTIDYVLRFDSREAKDSEDLSHVTTDIGILFRDAKGVIDFPPEAKSLIAWVGGVDEKIHRTCTH